MDVSHSNLGIIIDVMVRFRELGKCSNCKEYEKTCKKIMDGDKNYECNP